MSNSDQQATQRLHAAVNIYGQKMLHFIPARYVLALMGFTGMMMQYILKVNLSVAIVAMVVHNTNQTLESEENNENRCPNKNEVNVTSSSEQGDFHWGPNTESQVLASYYYGYVATQFLGGRSSEIVGPKLVMGCGVLFTGIFTLISPFAAKLSAYAFIAIRVLEGVCSGVILPAMQVLFSKWFPPEERSKFSGIVFSAIHMGSLLAMALSGIIEKIAGWEWIFYFFGIISILWTVPWMLLVFNSPNEHPRISKSELMFITTGIGASISSSDDSAENKSSSSVPWKKILLSTKIWSAALVQFGTAWVLYTLLSELPLYLKRVHHFNIQSSGIISSLPYLFDWISCSVSGLISQWIQVKGYVTKRMAYLIFNAIACIGSGICLLGITLADCNTTVIIILLIITMGCNGGIYGGSYLNHLDLAPNYAGSISGLIHTLVNSAGIWTPLVVTLITDGQDTLSRWKTVFYVSMSIVSLPYILYIFYGSVEELEWNRANQRTNSDIKDVPVTEL